MAPRLKRWHVLEKLVNDRGCAHGVEIGVYNGATFFYLLDSCPDLHIKGVDKWEAGEGVAYRQSELDKAYRGVMRRLEHYGARADILFGDSVEMARWVADGSLDFVFIDADHRTEAVLADIRAWAPKVKAEGFISGHDIDWPSVQEAVERACLSWSPMPDDVWLAERRDIEITEPAF